ncbi:AAA family ATPase [Lascolabacillus massiliensis]|jgi:AAA+ superfamily predicted ATPase|uniref:AAA family ATPase n=1 Tax=Lascolabacillus massiliensis TaxID=1627894 RepID=UPI0006B3B4EE|nr:ATP-binding protein [Lascolabacillus massiliensis]
MSQYDLIKDIAKYSFNDDKDQLIQRLNDLVEHSRRTKRTNFAIQLQSIIKDGIRRQELGGMSLYGSSKFKQLEEDKEIQELIIEKLTSDYKLSDLISSVETKRELSYFLKEQHSIDMLNTLDLPAANKVLLYGPSGCGKTLASYVIAGEMKRMMYVVNLGAIVSSKLGETSKNLSKLFKIASEEDSIIFLDEFDSLGKVRDYDQDHGEMKRVVNTILQLFDFLPKRTVVIAATNQINMIDEALIRRFDLSLKLDLPNKDQIKELVKNTLKNKKITFDNKTKANQIINKCIGLSYYIIQHTLLTALKRSLLDLEVDILPNKIIINTTVWNSLIEKEIQNRNSEY